MADVISLDQKLQDAKEKKSGHDRRRKLLAVKQVFQCTHCSLKCEKCGTQISAPDTDNARGESDLKVPYRFCESCADEYLDYIKRLTGGGNPDWYWHNDPWRAAWQKWIEYQGAVDSYTRSKEFVQLLHELKQTRPDK